VIRTVSQRSAVDFVFTKWGVRSFRGIVGAMGLTTGVVLMFRRVEPALVAAVLTFAGLALVHVGVDVAWDIMTGDGAGSAG
jgi:hypothetical protein